MTFTCSLRRDVTKFINAATAVVGVVTLTQTNSGNHGGGGEIIVRLIVPPVSEAGIPGGVADGGGMCGLTLGECGGKYEGGCGSGGGKGLGGGGGVGLIGIRKSRRTTAATPANTTPKQPIKIHNRRRSRQPSFVLGPFLAPTVATP